LVYPVTGPPGAGKTTALTYLDRHLAGLARFAVRDYGLRLAERGDPLGTLLRDPLLRHELLPDELVRGEFNHFLHHLGDGVRWVIAEGYPRDIGQCAHFVDTVASWGAKVPALVVIDVPDEVAVARTSRRRFCARCGVSAHPADPAECPDCGSRFTGRSDDAPARFGRRLADYRRLGAFVAAYFAERGALHVLDGCRSPIEVRRHLADLLTGDGI
jgi:adenylate kinase